MTLALLASLTYPVAEPFAGGLEKHTWQLAAGLSELGHRVDLYAAPGSAAPAGAKLVRWDRGYPRLLAEMGKKGYDLVHNNTVHFLPLAASMFLNAPVVTTLHTPPYRSVSAGAVAARITGGSRFVAISEHLAGRWRPYAGPCEVIYNGVDTDEFPFSPAGEPGHAVWAGRIAPEKGLEYAIAAARTAGYRLSIAGPIHDRGYFEKIRPLLGKDITYHGHLPGGELQELIGRSALGLFTSTWDEPFGLVLIEMLACGTPVAGFASGAAPEIVGPAVGSLVPVGDSEALAAAMPLAAGLSRADCRGHVENCFPLHRMARAYEALYRSLL